MAARRSRRAGIFSGAGQRSKRVAQRGGRALGERHRAQHVLAEQVALQVQPRAGAQARDHPLGVGINVQPHAVKELTVGSGSRFVDRGEKSLKGVPETWRLYAVVE